MTGEDLHSFLRDLDLSQKALARLLGVTPRAVQYWVTNTRAIPGPVEAYLRLLRLLQQAQLGVLIVPQPAIRRRT